MNDKTANPFARPYYVMAKPVSDRCNLACSYCYYSSAVRGGDGMKFSDGHAASRVMGSELLERFIKEYISIQNSPHVLFVWHGGEPLLLPVSYYREAFALQQKYAGGRYIDNVIQTNGVLITDEWCEFLKENNVLVGLSIDGTQEMHDHFRVDKARGKGSWADVMKGVDLLQRHGVEWNGMATVNSYNVQRPLEFYHFMKQIGCRYIQLSPIVERQHGELTPESIQPHEWGNFLKAIFDEWVRHDVGEYYVETFDCFLANWVGEEPGICVYAKECGNVGAIESNGDLYTCDHFAFPIYKIGNIWQNTLLELRHSKKVVDFSRKKSELLPRQCRECRFRFACNGECPKNRFLTDRYGEDGLNWLCEGYYDFFSYAAPYMDYMAQEYREGRAPANVMKINFSS